VDLRNQTDTLAYSVEKLLKDNRDKVGESEAKSVEEAVAEARKAMEGEDASALKSAMERLTALSHKLAESLYKSAPAAGGPEADAGSAPRRDGGGGDSDVVDAEYTVKH